jgi:hypothetical protein
VATTVVDIMAATVATAVTVATTVVISNVVLVAAAKKLSSTKNCPENRDIFQQKQGDYCGKTGNYDEGLGI